MSKRALALVLTLALVLALSACSKTETAPAATEPAQTTAPAEAAAQDTPAAEPAAESTSAEPASTETAASPEPAPASAPGELTTTGADLDDIPDSEGFLDTEFVGELSDVVIAYPLQYADNEVTFWTDFFSGFEEYGISDYNDLPAIPIIQEKTGIHYIFDCVSESAATEQFQLMIAAGDYDDVLMCGDYYSNGLGQAYEDEVIIDLTDLLPVHAPDYWNYIQQANQTTIDTVTTNGRHLQMCSLRDAVYSDGGYMFRQDWADALGFAFGDSTTTQEVSDFLYAMKEAYNPEYTLYVDAGGTLPGPAAFQTQSFSINNATSVSMYLNNGQAICSFEDDNYRAYLEWFHQLYADGIIDSDFYVSSMNTAEQYGAIGSGQMGMWSGFADSINKGKDYTDDPNFAAGALPIILDADGENKFGSETAYANNKGFQVTVDCDDPGKVLEFFNWFSTEEGYMFANYGTLGESYVINENGIVEFTDLITNNPDIPEFMMAMQIYTFNKAPALEIQSKLWGLYDIETVNAIRLWSIDDYTTTEKTIPTGAALSSEESASILNQVNDLIAYGSEQVLKFMTGSLELNDANWQEFQDGIQRLGVEQVDAVYQFAYEDFLAGNRQAAASSGPPGGPGGPPPDGDPGGPPPG